MDKRIALNPNEVVSFLEKSPETFTREDMLNFICEKNIRMIDFMYPAEDGRVKRVCGSLQRNTDPVLPVQFLQ